jgi:hypothetical protein
LAALAIQGGPHQSVATVLHDMAAVNASVRTYRVRIHFDSKVRTFVTLPLSLNATLYFKHPDKTQIVFDSVPQLAKGFQNFYASTGTPATWPKTYIVTLEPLEPGQTNTVTLRLTPRNSSNLDHALITVDSRTWGIAIQQWYYKDGSNINVTQFNEVAPGHVLPDRQLADFDFPKYKAHVEATYDTYEINVPIPDSIFKTPQQ